MSRDIHEPCGYVYGSDGCQSQCGEPAHPIEPAKLRAAIRERDLLLAAIVTAHGEALGTGHYRLAVPPEHTDSADARRLTIHRDPNSGAVLLRVSPI